MGLMEKTPMRLIALALCTVLTACAGAPPVPSDAASKVRAAQAADVAQCTYLDDIASVSSRYGVMAPAALEDTKAQVLKRAALAGATHVVWNQPLMANGSTTSSAKAYRCSGAK